MLWKSNFHFINSIEYYFWFELFEWWNKWTNKRIRKIEKRCWDWIFYWDSVLFKLPKGLTVADESQRGISAIGQFENNRFSIVITSNEDMVDYEINEDSLGVFSNFYSADIKIKKPVSWKTYRLS